MMKKYVAPEILSETKIQFETGISGGSKGDFPGLGYGVGGNPPNKEGEGNFPGNGNGNGWNNKDAGH